MTIILIILPSTWWLDTTSLFSTPSTSRCSHVIWPRHSPRIQLSLHTMINITIYSSLQHSSFSCRYLIVKHILYPSTHTDLSPASFSPTDYLDHVALSNHKGHQEGHYWKWIGRWPQVYYIYIERVWLWMIEYHVNITMYLSTQQWRWRWFDEQEEEVRREMGLKLDHVYLIIYNKEESI